MAKVRLIVDAYDRPQPSFDKPDLDRRQTETLHKGDVFDASGAELDRLHELGAVEDYKQGDRSERDALLDLAEQQAKRARSEHETLKKRDGVSKREVELSEDRLNEAERELERFKGKAKASPKRGQAAVDAAAAGEPPQPE